VIEQVSVRGQGDRHVRCVLPGRNNQVPLLQRFRAEEMEAWRAHGNLPQKVDGPEERLPGHHFALSGLRQEAVCAGQGTTSISRLREQQQLVDALSLCPLSSIIINHNITSLIWYLGLVPVSSNDKAPVRCLWVPEMIHVLANQL